MQKYVYYCKCGYIGEGTVLDKEARTVAVGCPECERLVENGEIFDVGSIEEKYYDEVVQEG